MAPQSRGLKPKPVSRKGTPPTKPSVAPTVLPPLPPPSLVSPSPDRTPTSTVPHYVSLRPPAASATAPASGDVIKAQESGLEDDEDGEEDADFQSQYSLAASSASESEDSDDGESDSEGASISANGASNTGAEGNSLNGNGLLGLHNHGSRTSLTISNSFAPPFYNRPPTPLPPSPSLTSLLRPPFSTTTSRPTTPDSSEVDTPPDTEAAVAKSARTATTVPRASPKVPTYEYYGFGVYLASTGVFIMYLLWSYLPSPFLHQLGIYYYPNRWWSLAIPSFLVMLILYIYVALASYNTGYLTLPMNSIENLVDDAANIAAVDENGHVRKHGHGAEEDNVGVPWREGWEGAWNTGTDGVMDVPIGAVNEILYGNLVFDENEEETIRT
ncbi:MAG: hypothetical protein M1814_003354 [Vezdaea aestivalis]|nr:MAG: hypothetical protein M1814_003354 [Vezdaea aestivalis]